MPHHEKGRIIVMVPEELTEKQIKEIFNQSSKEGLGKAKIFISGAFPMFPSCDLYILDVSEGSEAAWIGSMRKKGILAYRLKHKRNPAAYRKTHILLRS